MQKFSASALEKINMDDGLTPAEFALWCDEHKGEGMQWRNQTDFLSHARLDQILRFERLEEGLRSLPFVVDEFAMPIAHNNMPRRNILDDLTPEFRDAVNIHSGPDFERFGYAKL